MAVVIYSDKGSHLLTLDGDDILFKGGVYEGKDLILEVYEEYYRSNPQELGPDYLSLVEGVKEVMEHIKKVSRGSGVTVYFNYDLMTLHMVARIFKNIIETIGGEVSSNVRKEFKEILDLLGFPHTTGKLSSSMCFPLAIQFFEKHQKKIQTLADKHQQEMDYFIRNQHELFEVAEDKYFEIMEAQKIKSQEEAAKKAERKQQKAEARAAMERATVTYKQKTAIPVMTFDDVWNALEDKQQFKGRQGKDYAQWFFAEKEIPVILG